MNQGIGRLDSKLDKLIGSVDSLTEHLKKKLISSANS